MKREAIFRQVKDGPDRCRVSCSGQWRSILFLRTSSDLWTWKIGLPTGAVFGAFALSAIYLMGGGVRDSPTGLMGAWLLGGACGLATAAITSRRKITNEC